MSDMAPQITGVLFFFSTIAQGQIKRNIKAPRHWPCEGNSPVTGEFPAQKPVTRKMFPFNDAIMLTILLVHISLVSAKPILEHFVVIILSNPHRIFFAFNSL